MSKSIELKNSIPSSLHGSRLDAALGQLFPDYSRSQFKLWIESNAVKVNNEVVTKPKTKVNTDDVIHIEAVLEARENWQPQNIQLNVLFEDADILIINKPTGLVVHPGAGNYDQTMVNALLHFDPELQSVPRAGLIHRLDKDTTGLLVIARNLKSHHALINMMKERLIKRYYLALVHGVINVGGTIDKPIARHSQQRTKMAIMESGKPAITHYKVQEKFTYHTLLAVQLQTGRTHQIRVHMASIQHPIVGDAVYGGKRLPQKDLTAEARQAILHFNRQALHAEKLSFTHPFSDQPLEFIAPLPDDLQQLINSLK